MSNWAAPWTGADETRINGLNGNVVLTSPLGSVDITVNSQNIELEVSGSVVSGYVPYTGATGNVDLGAYRLSARFLTVEQDIKAATSSGVSITSNDGYTVGSFGLVVGSGVANGVVWQGKHQFSGNSPNRLAYFDNTSILQSVTMGGSMSFSSGTLNRGALTGDVTASAGSTATTIAANAVTDAKIRQSAGLSVIGNSTNATANVADITASTDNTVMRRSGSTIGWGAVNLTSSNAVTGVLPIARGGSGTGTTPTNGQLLIGNGTDYTLAVITVSNGIGITNGAGSIALSLGAITPTSVAATGTVTGSNISGTNTGDQTITLTGDVTGSGTGSFAATIATNAVTNSKFRQSAGLSVVGNSTNATANVADITASTDNTVLRRSGSAIGWGAVNLTSSDAVTGVLPRARGGTGTGTAPTNGQLLIGNGTDYTLAAITATANQLTVTNGAGSIALSLPSTLILPGTLQAGGNVNLAAYTINNGYFTGRDFLVNDPCSSSILGTLNSAATFSAADQYVKLHPAGSTTASGQINYSYNPAWLSLTFDMYVSSGGGSPNRFYAYAYTASIPLSDNASADGYIFSFDFDNDTFKIFYNNTVLSTTSLTLNLNTYYTATVLCNPTTGAISAYLGSTLVVSYTDTSAPRSASGTPISNNARLGVGGIVTSVPTEIRTRNISIENIGVGVTGFSNTCVPFSNGTRLIQDTLFNYTTSTGVLAVPALTLTTALTPTSGGTGTTTAFTTGSVVFAGASGVYSQDNSNLCWDNSNKRFGIGTSSPSGTAHLKSDTSTPLWIDRNNAGTRKSSIVYAQQGTAKFEVGIDLSSANSQDYYVYDNAAGAARLLIDSGGTLNLYKALTITGTPPSTQALYMAPTFAKAGADANPYWGSYCAPTYNATSGTLSGVLACYAANPQVTGNVGTLTNVYGFYGYSGSALAGTVTNSYGAYFSRLAFGTNKTALYADDICVGYTGVNAGGNNVLISGGVGIGIQNPATKLHLYGGRFRIDQTDGAAGSAVIELTNGSVVNYIFADGPGGALFAYTASGRPVYVNAGGGTTGSVYVGPGSVATNATTGFVRISYSAGAPTGAPDTGDGSIHIDTTGSKLYARIGGVWKSILLV